MKNEIERVVMEETKWSFDPNKLMVKMKRVFFKEEKLKYGIHPFRGCIVLITVPAFKTFPAKNADFNTYVNVGIPYLTANSPRLVSAANLAILRNLYDLPVGSTTNWLFIQTKVSDPLVSNTYWTDMQEERRHEIEQIMITIFHDIPESVWTLADRNTLRRPAKATTHTPAQIMGVAPDMTLALSFHLGIKLHFHNPLTPETDAMPYSNHIQVEYFIGAKGLDPSTMVFGNSTDVKRFLQLFAFTEAQSGQWVYFRCRYVNSKGEPSLIWSATLPLQIP